MEVVAVAIIVAEEGLVEVLEDLEEEGQAEEDLEANGNVMDN